MARRALFDDREAYFFGVSVDPKDRSERGAASQMPGVRWFWDFDAAVSRQYGVAQNGVYKQVVFLVDRNMRVVQTAPLAGAGALMDRLEQELKAERAAPDLALAPILTIPRVFEPEFCAELIAYYERAGGEVSGFMQSKGGKTYGRHDESKKRRRDAFIEDPVLRDEALRRLTTRLMPAVHKAFAWQATRVERYIVSCYSGEDGGFFFPHRDNQSPATAHRKFAVTLNLNAGDYDGGELRFPEFGPRLYKPPTGGATVFGCGLLHEAKPVTRGVRYAFLPFLYDEEGQKLRDAGARTIVPGVVGAGQALGDG